MSTVYPVTHCIVGAAPEVATVLRAASARGHLIRYSRPQRLTGNRVAITVTLLQGQPVLRRPTTGSRSARRRQLRRIAITAGILAGSAAFAGLLWLVAVLVEFVLAHWVFFAVLAVIRVVLAAAAQEKDGRR